MTNFPIEGYLSVRAASCSHKYPGNKICIFQYVGRHSWMHQRENRKKMTKRGNRILSLFLCFIPPTISLSFSALFRHSNSHKHTLPVLKWMPDIGRVSHIGIKQVYLYFIFLVGNIGLWSSIILTVFPECFFPYFRLFLRTFNNLTKMLFLQKSIVSSAFWFLSKISI